VIVDIGLFGATRWGDERSERYVSDLYAVFQRLVDGHAFGRRCNRIRPGLWRIEQASHVVFFRRPPGGLLICRVLHKRQLPEVHRIDDDE
jgi:plasmid stabilization system protein ParE